MLIKLLTAYEIFPDIEQISSVNYRKNSVIGNYEILKRLIRYNITSICKIRYNLKVVPVSGTLSALFGIMTVGDSSECFVVFS